MGLSEAQSRFFTLVMALIFVTLTGFLLLIGKSLLLPIVLAVITAYILVSASDWLGRQPGIRHLPEWVRRVIVLACFVLCILSLVGVITSTVDQVGRRVPEYQENLTAMAADMAHRFGLEKVPNWGEMWRSLTERVSMQTIASRLIASAGSLAGVVFMVVIYTMFLMGERSGFGRKLTASMSGERAEQTHHIITKINKSIGNYLSVKTLVNIILAAGSYLVLLIFGIDFALFWAILIGLLNYIPYIGSLAGVMFPVALTLAQYGSLQKTLIVAGLLTAAQMFVGNVLEPKMIGKTVNMSPFVVLVALAVWSALWGVSGAILAIPLTAVITIILANFEATRPFAIMLADDVDLVD